jgi:Na+/melibiose symporter-like transporter
MASTPTSESTTEEGVHREPTTVEKIQNLHWSISSNVANTIFVQFTFFGSVFVLFLNELGLSKGEVGFVLSLLPFSGLISLFVAPAVARFGYKRTYLTFWTLRSVIAAFLLLTPWIVLRYGAERTLLFISITVALFALVRSVGMTANLPWVQEFVPNSVRGKYTARNNVYTSLAGFAAIIGGGFVLGQIVGLTGYMILIGLGVVAGLVSVWLAAYIPGGAPQPARAGERKPRDIGAAMRDSSFQRYLFGVGILTLATVPLASFVPLFMREEVGLQQGNIVLLQIGSLAGGLFSSYMWGWAADRYGSKPVMLWGLVLRILLPVLWIIMPKGMEWSLYFAMGIALFQGVSDMGWGIGSARILYVSIVPTAKRSDYMALYNAWIGIAGGLSVILGGQILAISQRFYGQIAGVDPAAYLPGALGELLAPPINFIIFGGGAYLPLFLMGILLPILSIVIMRAISAEDTLGLGEFAGIFFRGNPFLAMTSLIRFHLARDEQSTVRVTERLGETRSPLAVDELLEALQDPRFNVRFEAIISMSRMPPEPRLIDALVEILHGSELALTVIAAWALGRIGDQHAYEPLRQALDSEYRSIQAHSARALGNLGNKAIVPVLHERLVNESDKGLQMAYAYALGNLGAKEATEDILALLNHMQNEGARLELALTLSRIVGDEHHYIHLLRSVRADAGTAIAQELTGLKRRLVREQPAVANVAQLVDECINHFARSEMERGALSLGHLLEVLSLERLDPSRQAILRECRTHLADPGEYHIDYILLALHTLVIAGSE